MRIELSTGTPAELARPSGVDHPTRGLVVFPDIMGLRPLFDGMCQRLADEQGWVVCAPEPFPGAEQLDVGERLSAMAQASDERFRVDAIAAAEATGCEQVGAIGFCMGGMLAFKAAGTGRFDRTAGFYGMIRLPVEWRGPTHADAIDLLLSSDRCPVMAIIGTADPYTPEADVADAEAAGVHIVRYEGAEHGFVHDASRPAHRADDAADAWRRVVAFLRSE
jgi:carboxymethylenebutenolidase